MKGSARAVAIAAAVLAIEGLPHSRGAFALAVVAAGIGCLMLRLLHLQTGAIAGIESRSMTRKI